jgi:hypothetical protein
MKKVIVTIIVISAVFIWTIPGYTLSSIVMYSGSDRCHGYVDNISPYNTFECWIFVNPEISGVKGLKFKMELPPNVVLIEAELNPLFGIPIVPIQPWVAPGASWGFEPCQTDWFWTHRITFLLIDPTPSYIKIVPHDESGMISATDCSDEEQELTVLDFFCVNEYCGPITPALPYLQSIKLLTHTSLIAKYDLWSEAPEVVFLSGNVQAMDYPEDHIEVVDCVPHPSEDGSVILTLESAMTDGRSYFLNTNVCGRCDCGTESLPFYFEEEIDARNSTWGGIKSLWR